ncbi:MAG: hypothetical protein GYA33_03330, partial [Thermogutta sp.]|nr:hypothetical protein [Thermogutta sp.]
MNFLRRNREEKCNGSPQSAPVMPDSPDARETDFQRLKTRIHREVLESLDLSRLAKLDEAELRRHVRNL